MATGGFIFRSAHEKAGDNEGPERFFTTNPRDAIAIIARRINDIDATISESPFIFDMVEHPLPN